MVGSFLVLAITLLDVTRSGVSLTLEGEKQIDPARSTFLTLTIKAPRGVKADAPDLRDRVKGFSLAEDFAEEPVAEKDGSVTQVVNWKLVPEPCADVYKLAPFVVPATGAGDVSFWAGPVYFDPPAAREPVTGEMETDPKKDLPPLTLKLAGWIALWLAGALTVLAAVWFAVRYLARKVKEHRMSPIERAWVELDRLIQKGLPGRGKYKDFYVELTMVVRRYVQRKYGIKAPHLTTEEFLREIAARPTGQNPEGTETRRHGEMLKEFLESADMVKFAGVQATPEMADDATARARSYLDSDSTR